MRYSEILEACWKGYRQAGMKKKGDRMVPNCVPVSEQEMEEDLKKWFKEKWVRFGPDGKIRGDCARGSSSEGKPKCLPQAKAHALGKKGRASAAAKKRREDPNPERRGKAKNVATKVREQGVAEARSITKPEDPVVAIRRFSAYVQKNIYDLASMADFEHENSYQPYVDERFEGYLTGANGQPVTPIFNQGGELKLVGSKKQYLNIPTDLYYTYRGLMGGGEFTKKIMQALGYKQGMKEQHDWDDADEFGMPGSEFFSDEDDRLRDGDYVRDRQDGEHGEIFRMSGDPSERRVRILDRDGRGWYISPERLVAVDRNDPDIMKYFGKKRRQDIDEKQDACYRKVKSRYKVWPSAYASGALVQCRKKGAANWGNKSKK